jgi:hypothetical protein
MGKGGEKAAFLRCQRLFGVDHFGYLLKAGQLGVGQVR